MRRAAPFVLLLALLIAPVAAAGPQPALYFLKDGEMGPVMPGVLNQTAPDSLDPSIRLVYAGTPDLPSASFATQGIEHPGHIRGPLFVGLWPGPSAVLDGNITIAVYSQAPDGALSLLGSASQDIDFNESNAPDPLSLVPPDPTDPEAAVLYVAGQALGALLQPPMLLYLGVVDVEIPLDHQLVLGLYLEPGDDNPLPIPVGAAATLQYDGQLMPSFAYIPWYAPDPPPSDGSGSGGSGSGSGGSGDGSGSGSGSGTGSGGGSSVQPEEKGTPGVGPVVLLALVGLAAWVARRRV